MAGAMVEVAKTAASMPARVSGGLRLCHSQEGGYRHCVRSSGSRVGPLSACKCHPMRPALPARNAVATRSPPADRVSSHVLTHTTESGHHAPLAEQVRSPRRLSTAEDTLAGGLDVMPGQTATQRQALSLATGQHVVPLAAPQRLSAARVSPSRFTGSRHLDLPFPRLYEPTLSILESGLVQKYVTMLIAKARRGSCGAAKGRG